MATGPAEIEIRKVRAGRGAGWVGAGWRMFIASPGMWVVLTIIWLLISIALQMVPLAGMLAGLLVAPILGAGLLLAADDIDKGRELDVGTLFRPVTADATRNPMLVLGGIYLGANMAVMVVAMLLMIVGVTVAIARNGMQVRPEQIDPSRIDPGQIDPAMLYAMGGFAVLVVLLIVALVLLITILFYFAIPLVAFGRAEPGRAIASGTRALLRNWAPLTILGLLYLPLSLLATIPLGLGWLILVPMTVGMWYASFRDVFPQVPEPSSGYGDADLPPPPAVDP